MGSRYFRYVEEQVIQQCKRIFKHALAKEMQYYVYTRYSRVVLVGTPRSGRRRSWSVGGGGLKPVCSGPLLGELVGWALDG